MRIDARMYRETVVWKRRKLSKRPILRAIWRPFRWPAILMSYGGAFVSSLVVLWAVPFGVIATFTGDLPTSTAWLVLSGITTTGTVAFLPSV